VKENLQRTTGSISMIAMEDFAQFERVACSESPWAKQDRVQDHDPKWHEFGVLGHCERVFRHAIQIKRLTGIDVVRAALWHDIGKFVKDGRREKDDKPGEFTFKGHEEKGWEFLTSGENLKRYGISGFSDEDLFSIRNHGIVRGQKTLQQILGSCEGENNHLKRLVLMCSADTAGKGYTPDQDKERLQLAPKFVGLALEAGLGSRIASLVLEIVMEW
jgi:putative nucleotidyltransferase with HDIG domain